MRLHRSPRAPRAGFPRLTIAATALVLAATAAACASQQPAGVQPAGLGATTAPGQAYDVRTPQSSGSATSDAGVIVTLGTMQAPPTPRTLPCLSGTTTVQMNADGTDPTTICAHLGADITLHLPPTTPGHWSAPTVTDTHTITVTSTPTSQGGLDIRVRADTPGTSQINTWAYPSAGEQAPARNWTTAITVVP